MVRFSAFGRIKPGRTLVVRMAYRVADVNKAPGSLSPRDEVFVGAPPFCLSDIRDHGTACLYRPFSLNFVGSHSSERMTNSRSLRSGLNPLFETDCRRVVLEGMEVRYSIEPIFAVKCD